MEDRLAWTAATRMDYARPYCGYASEMTEREWGLILTLLPAPKRDLWLFQTLSRRWHMG